MRLVWHFFPFCATLIFQTRPSRIDSLQLFWDPAITLPGLALYPEPQSEVGGEVMGAYNEDRHLENTYTMRGLAQQSICQIILAFVGGRLKTIRLQSPVLILSRSHLISMEVSEVWVNFSFRLLWNYRKSIKSYDVPKR